MSLAADYSYSRPSVAALKSGGVVTVIRYLAPQKGKRIDRAEYQMLKASGVGVALVWEWHETRPLKGYFGGLADGKTARAQADAIGFPSARPIFAAYDFSVSPANVVACIDYQRGFNDGAGSYGAAYGTGYLLEEFRKRGIARYLWQTNARGWYGNRPDYPYACLRQHYGKTVPGVPKAAIDLNDVLGPDHGQDSYRPPAPKPDPTPTPTPTPEELTVDPCFIAITSPTPMPQYHLDGYVLTALGSLTEKSVIAELTPGIPTHTLTVAEFTALQGFLTRRPS